MKRVSQGTSAASSAKRSSAIGSRSMRDQRPRRAQAVGDEARVAAAAERAVDGDLARLRVQRFDQLAGEHRDVGLGHVKKDGQGTR